MSAEDYLGKLDRKNLNYIREQLPNKAATDQKKNLTTQNDKETDDAQKKEAEAREAIRLKALRGEAVVDENGNLIDPIERKRRQDATKNRDELSKIYPNYGNPVPSGSTLFSQIRLYEQSTGAYVDFPIRPEISESSSTYYNKIENDIRQPGGFKIYLGTSLRTFRLTATLVSRTRKEALKNYRKYTLIRSWTMPDRNGLARTDGVTDFDAKKGIDASAPTIVYLYGYGKLFKGIPTTVDNLSIVYKTDVDYIPIEGDDNTSIPILFNIDLTLGEIRYPDELLKTFDLNMYKKGELERW